MKTLTVVALLFASMLGAAVPYDTEIVRGDVHVVVKPTAIMTWDMFGLTPKGLLVQVWSTNPATKNFTVTVTYKTTDGTVKRISDVMPVLAGYNFGLTIVPLNLNAVAEVVDVEVAE